LRKIIASPPPIKGFIHALDYSVQGLDSGFDLVRGRCKFASRSKQKPGYGAAWTQLKSLGAAPLFLDYEKHEKHEKQSTDENSFM